MQHPYVLVWMPFGNSWFQFWNNPNNAFADQIAILPAAVRFTWSGLSGQYYATEDNIECRNCNHYCPALGCL